MKRLLLIGFALVSFNLFTGCIFSKKSAKPKENPAIATELEENFKVRWVEKRSGELVTQGQTPEAAKAQAGEEFRVKYGYTHAAQK
jgi:hypothetical protein